MAKVNDLIKEFKGKIQALINKDSSAEEIEANTNLVNELDAIEQEANQNLEDRALFAQKYIEAVRGAGSPKAEKEPNEESKAPTLEELIAKELESGKDKAK